MGNVDFTATEFLKIFLRLTLTGDGLRVSVYWNQTKKSSMAPGCCVTSYLTALLLD